MTSQELAYNVILAISWTLLLVFHTASRFMQKAAPTEQELLPFNFRAAIAGSRPAFYLASVLVSLALNDGMLALFPRLDVMTPKFTSYSCFCLAILLSFSHAPYWKFIVRSIWKEVNEIDSSVPQSK